MLKIENFQLKNFDIFLIFALNIDCGYTLEPPRRGGSNEYPQSMFWSKNKKNRYTPANPSFPDANSRLHFLLSIPKDGHLPLFVDVSV